MEKIEKFIGLHFKVGACNLRCSYCYVGQHKNEILKIPFSMDDIRIAFSRKRLGGTCFINICSDGEPLIHSQMPQIIKFFLEEGHFVMVLTNGLLKKRIEECFENVKNLERLFFKISFHYEELVRLNLIDRIFENIEFIKNSPCSLTVEYITCDETLENIEKLKDLCLEKMGALPQVNIPRDERGSKLGVVSKYTWKEYTERWESEGFNSEFFEFRKQFFGKKYKGFCYTGERQLWIDMSTGYSRQCYHTPVLQDFMGEKDKPIKWLAVGNNCGEAHCYVAHSHMTLGIVPFPDYTRYKPTYDVIRNRKCIDGTEWIKPIYKEAFQMGVRQEEFSMIKKSVINKLNRLLNWERRREKF